MELDSDFVPSANGDATGATDAQATPPEQQHDETTEQPEGGEKPRGGVGKRIDELTANWRNEQRRAQQLEQLLAQALSQPQQQQPQQPQPPAQPSPAGKPSIEQFNTYDEYVEALSDWKFEQRMQAMTAQQEQQARAAQEAQRSQSFQQRASQFAAQHDDYDLVALNPNLPVSPAMARAIQSHESGPHMLYALGQNPAEAARIAALPPEDAAFALAGFWYSQQAPKPTPKPAPTPINPIGTGVSSATTGPNGEHIADADEWARWRNEQLRRK